MNDKLVTCNFMGGLGNQLFQICATLGYASKYGHIPVFNLDKNDFPLQGKPPITYKNNLFQKLKDISTYKSITDNKVVYLKENNFSYTPLIYLDSSVILEGYFQSEKYFENIKNNISEIFIFSEDTLNKVNSFLDSFEKKEQTTSIHIRRGDYLNYTDIYIQLSLEYFNKGMSFFEKNNFVIVSDDIDWCKENFKQENIYFSPFENEIDDLCLMTRCDNNIISNSTFGWWGAYLNSNKNKKIVSPENWFISKGIYDTKDLLPTEWIKI